RLHALDRFAPGIQTNADVLAAVVQVQRVRATLRAITDHRHRLAERRRAVEFVVDLHSLFLITTGPERTTSTIPCRASPFTKSATLSASPENSTVVPSDPVDRTFAPRFSSASSSEAATVATTSSRLCTSSPVRSSTSTTSTSRSSCLRTWSASAWPWSICRVMRECPGCRLGPTEIPRTWKPRRRITPETLVSVFCPSSTSNERTRILVSFPFTGSGAAAGFGFISSIFRGLPELVEALAERDDRVDVGLGVDAKVDQERTLRALRGVEGRRDVLELLDPKCGQAVCLAKFHEVRHVGQVDLGAHSAIEVVLELADHAQREVVEEHDLDVELMLDRDRQLLRCHHKAALARDAPDRKVRPAELGADRGRQRETHRARATRVDEQARSVVVPPEGGPDLVLADVGDNDRLALGAAIHVDQHVLRLELSVRVPVAKRMLLAPLVDLSQPIATVRMDLADVRQHRLERQPRVGDQLDVRPHVLPHLGLVDVDVDERLDVGRKLGKLRGDSVVDPHADHHQDVRVLDRLQAPARTRETGHVQRQRVLDRERADAEERRPYGGGG